MTLDSSDPIPDVTDPDDVMLPPSLLVLERLQRVPCGGASGLLIKDLSLPQPSLKKKKQKTDKKYELNV